MAYVIFWGGVKVLNELIVTLKSKLVWGNNLICQLLKKYILTNSKISQKVKTIAAMPHWPKFNSQDPHPGKKVLTPTSAKGAHMHTKKINK